MANITPVAPFLNSPLLIVAINHTTTPIKAHVINLPNPDDPPIAEITSANSLTIEPNIVNSKASLTRNMNTEASILYVDHIPFKISYFEFSVKL
ncbi:Uncharacterised protein [Staphylococcus aureus]|nr:Uncharacterised protein [Staphylococcus aureus]